MVAANLDFRLSMTVPLVGFPTLANKAVACVAQGISDDDGMAGASARLQEAHGVVALEQGEASARGQPLRGFEISVAGEYVFG